MNDDPQRGDSPEKSKGVFGNLPDSRPGARSPRRRGGSAADSKAARATTATGPRAAAKKPTAASTASRSRTAPAPPPAAKPDPAPAPSAQPKRRPQDAAHQDPEPPLPRAAGLEDLAWAGVAVAAEAATLGVRLASRAIDAMRGTTEKE